MTFTEIEKFCEHHALLNSFGIRWYLQTELLWNLHDELLLQYRKKRYARKGREIIAKYAPEGIYEFGYNFNRAKLKPF